MQTLQKNCSRYCANEAGSCVGVEREREESVDVVGWYRFGSIFRVLDSVELDLILGCHTVKSWLFI